MTVYWGGANVLTFTTDDLGENWARDTPIRFVPVLSEPPATDSWAAEPVSSMQAAMQDFPDLSGHQVYVCGSPAMVAAARRDFVGQCKLPENEFFADSFEFANDVSAKQIQAISPSRFQVDCHARRFIFPPASDQPPEQDHRHPPDAAC
jgi:CDP-4-dehydro-6-deoxyglucose reductase